MVVAKEILILDQCMLVKMEPGPCKKAKRQCHFDPSWTKTFRGIGKSIKGNFYSACLGCSFTVTVLF